MPKVTRLQAKYGGGKPITLALHLRSWFDKLTTNGGGGGVAGAANALNQRLCKIPRHKRPQIINPLANTNKPQCNRPLFGDGADDAAFGAAV